MYNLDKEIPPNKKLSLHYSPYVLINIFYILIKLVPQIASLTLVESLNIDTISTTLAKGF